ncbi:hypothetical protein MC885_005146 [Smutsia gigantea]|nr:hypothetical protein MC885_005146 [Smutsia gigantea]
MRKNLSTLQSRLDVYLAQIPAGTSAQNIQHWAQAANSGLFQAFDWGNPDQNMIHFHQVSNDNFGFLLTHLKLKLNK